MLMQERRKIFLQLVENLQVALDTGYSATAKLNKASTCWSNCAELKTHIFAVVK